MLFRSQIEGLPADYGYVGLILIQTFAFAMLRLPFTLIGLLDAVTSPAYLAVAVSTGSLEGRRRCWRSSTSAHSGCWG